MRIPTPSTPWRLLILYLQSGQEEELNPPHYQANSDPGEALYLYICGCICHHCCVHSPQKKNQRRSQLSSTYNQTLLCVVFNLTAAQEMYYSLLQLVAHSPKLPSMNAQ